jgi:hypothetical protein
MDNKDKKSLKEFLRENDFALSAVSITAGLATLLGSVKPESNTHIQLYEAFIIPTLSFVMMFASLIILDDIRSRLRIEKDWNLKFFSWALTISFWLITAYVLLQHRIISTFFLPIALFYLFAIPFEQFLIKHSVRIRKAKRWLIGKKIDEKIINIFLFIVVAFLAYYIEKYAFQLGNSINAILNFLSSIQIGSKTG